MKVLREVRYHGLDYWGKRDGSIARLRLCRRADGFLTCVITNSRGTAELSDEPVLWFHRGVQQNRCRMISAQATVEETYAAARVDASAVTR